MNSRDECLRRVREGLGKGTAQSELPTAPTPGGRQDLQTTAARSTAFVEAVSSVGGVVHRVADEREAARVFAKIVAERGLERMARSDSPRLASLGESVPRVDWIEPTPFPTTTEARAPLFDTDAGLTTAQMAIAETGTLVLDSSVELHRLASLVPPLHIALLNEADIVSDLSGLFDRYSTSELPPTLTMITGPSRTADIELELVVGVHGPRELVVLLVAEH